MQVMNAWIGLNRILLKPSKKGAGDSGVILGRL